ncbi:tetratricopeptide repeat protein [bacterium]|nr:MAG: tetratricopeptide repeat protein [bacterium]
MKIKSRYKFLFSFYVLSATCYPLRVYADTLSRAEALYLQGSYSESIDECAINIARDANRGKAYYLLGLNYIKINQSDKAREKLKIVTDSYRASPFYDSAKLAYADTYFIEQDYSRARELYEDIARGNSKLVPCAYLRLGQCALKAGNWEGAKNYADTLKQKYPLSLEARVSGELLEKQELFFTVQVGSFASAQNAKALMNKLKQKNFDAYIDELTSPEAAMYRVRVGKVSTRREAENLKDSLEASGYPTHIFP